MQDHSFVYILPGSGSGADKKCSGSETLVATILLFGPMSTLLGVGRSVTPYYMSTLLGVGRPYYMFTLIGVGRSVLHVHTVGCG